MILVQIKGGSAAWPSKEDTQRLKAVAKHYDARCVVLFEWIKGKSSTFHELRTDIEFHQTTREALFGKQARGKGRASDAT